MPLSTLTERIVSAMPDYFTVSHISRKDLARIFSKITISADRSYNGSPCWEWTGSKVHGYGNMRWEGKVRRVHRIMYSWIYGPIPHRGAKLEIDHLCKNPSCVNVCHLELVTSQVNCLRSNNLAAQYAPRMHCNYGHEFTEANTILVSRKGAISRKCRQCKNEWRKKKCLADASYAESLKKRQREAMRKRRASLRNQKSA